MDNWRSSSLGACGTWLSGGTPPNTPEYWNGDIPWISGKSLHEIYISESEDKVTELGAHHGTRLVPARTILLLVRGMMLKKRIPVGITMRSVTFNQDVKALIPSSDIEPEFLLNWIIAHETQLLHLVEESSHGTGKLSTDVLQDVEVLLPPLAEQRKIAAILSTWDEAITLTRQLIAALQRRKQALMQLLLTGAVRFPEFAVTDQVQEAEFGTLPADWEYVEIHQIANQVLNRNKVGEGLPVLSCTKYDGLVDSLEYFGRQIFSDDLSTYKVVHRGQFAYATNHIEEGSIGYQNLYENALISPMYTVFETTDRVNDAFLYRVLKTELYRHIFEINTSASVDRRGSLRWDAFSKIRIPLPSLEEQVAISTALAEADKVNQLYADLSSRLQAQKRGLMQRLLTGAVPVSTAAL